MKRIIQISLATAAIIAAIVAAGPYLTLNNIKNSLIENDPAKLAENIDFPLLRQNLKEQINAAMIGNASEDAENPFALLAAGLVTAMTEKIIDGLITPNGMATTFGKEHAENKAELFQNAQITFDSISKASARIKNENNIETRMILQREGITWKLTNIIIPDIAAATQQ